MAILWRKPMLDNKKIRVMTKLAICEQKSSEDIRMSMYYKTDYVRLQLMKTIISVTVGYILLLFIIGFFQAEFLLGKTFDIDFIRLGQYIVGFYIIILTVYIAASFFVYSYKYDKSRKKLSKYYKLLQELNHIYREEQIDE
jgi:hypothetical protein